METQNGGEVKHFMLSKLNDWKSQQINIAICGLSGSGKSSFINTIRGLSAEDEGAAHVDIVECTTACTPYQHPNHPLLCYWELPGIGTPSNPKDIYLREVNLDK